MNSRFSERLPTKVYLVVTSGERQNTPNVANRHIIYIVDELTEEFNAIYKR